MRVRWPPEIPSPRVSSRIWSVTSPRRRTATNREARWSTTSRHSGLTRTSVRALPTTPQIAALVAAQLAWIDEDHPVAILGFLELEAHSADLAMVERLIEQTGLPREAFGQLLLHAKLEPVHAKELHRVLDALPLEAEHEELIGLSALRSMSLITEAFLDAIVDTPTASVIA